MKQYKVAILGASGAVGKEMMKILEERSFPVSELHLLASARSAGKVVQWRGQDVVIEEARDEAFEGIDIVLGAAENDIAERFAPAIVKSGAVFVDNSSAFRLDPDVPLVVPEVNPEGRKEAPRHHRKPQLLHHDHRHRRERAAEHFAHQGHGRLHVSGRVRRGRRRPH